MLLALLFLMLPAPIFTVNADGDAPDANPGDGICATAAGTCTFLAAVEESNALPETDTLSFAIDWVTSETVPIVTDPIVLLGTGTSVHGLTLQDRNHVIQNMHFRHSLSLAGEKGGSTITGSLIGVSADSMAVAEGSPLGLVLTASSNTIGGLGEGDRNIISHISFGGRASDNLILGNYIGISGNGIDPLSPASDGPHEHSGIELAAPGNENNTIGPGNRIGGHAEWGIALTNAGRGNQVIGNLIFQNGAGGIMENGIGGNVLGAPGGGNFITENEGPGIEVGGVSQSTTVQANFIGTDSTLASDLGNQGPGILVDKNNALIGGLEPETFNTIAYNADVGIWMDVSIQILGNSIYMNEGLGINYALEPRFEDENGVNVEPLAQLTPNPSLERHDENRISLSLQTTPADRNQFYRVSFFSSPTCDDSGYGEGQSFLAADTVMTDEMGLAVLDTVFTVEQGIRFITAMANHETDGTSEFSNCVDIRGNDATSIENEPLASLVLEGNYPNPFDNQTYIVYTLDSPQHVSLIVYDVLGRKVSSLVDAPVTAGRHEAVFRSDDVVPGVYLYELRAGTYRTTGKMLHSPEP